MILRSLVLSIVAASVALPALAEVAPGNPAPMIAVRSEVARLSDLMMIDGMMDVMRDEGMDYGGVLEDEMFPGKGGTEWRAAVGRIYEPGRMRAEYDAVLERELADDPQTLAAAIEFFGAPRGQNILRLELEARRALLDDAADEAARHAVEELEASGSPRLDALRAFAETNDLVELNVMGALNSNLAFYRGLSDAGAFDDAMTEDAMLADIWGQEAEIRAETEEWLFSFLALAYQPLSDEDLAAYQAFSETPEGQRLNAAVFAAFDAPFVRISRELGLAVALRIQGEDI